MFRTMSKALVKAARTLIWTALGLALPVGVIVMLHGNIKKGLLLVWAIPIGATVISWLLCMPELYLFDD